MGRLVKTTVVVLSMFWASPLFAAWAFINHAEANGVSTCNDTPSVAGVNMTGADTLFMLVSQTNGTADPTLSDGGDTFTKIIRATQSSQSDITIYRASSITGGGSMTFTAVPNTGGSCLSFVVLGFSGGHASPDDLTRSNTGASVTSLLAGSSSLTPGENNCVVLATQSYVATGDTVTVNGGFSTVYQTASIASVSWGVAGAYLIQTTATAAQPTFSWMTSISPTTAMGDFKSAAGGGGAATVRQQRCSALGAC